MDFDALNTCVHIMKCHKTERIMLFNNTGSTTLVFVALLIDLMKYIIKWFI